MPELTNDSPVGRLLEELSWEGNARKYRQGGRGLENVLVTEVFQALDLLPRAGFLGEVLLHAHGDNTQLRTAVAEIEDAVVDVLPGGPDLAEGGPNIQPDVVVRMPAATILVEAKRIRPGSFQLEQLAREYLVLTRDFRGPTKILLLILPSRPPVPVKGLGRVSVETAIIDQLERVRARASHPPSLERLRADLARTCAWTTWAEVDRALAEGVRRLNVAPPSVRASVVRGAEAARRAIAWHS